MQQPPHVVGPHGPETPPLEPPPVLAVPPPVETPPPVERPPPVAMPPPKAEPPPNAEPPPVTAEPPPVTAEPPPVARPPPVRWHAPKTQLVPLPHEVHISAFLPHAAFEVPTSHKPPAVQQPFMHVIEHVAGTGGEQLPKTLNASATNRVRVRIGHTLPLRHGTAGSSKDVTSRRATDLTNRAAAPSGGLRFSL